MIGWRGLVAPLMVAAFSEIKYATGNRELEMQVVARCDRGA
jgi:hypothetical protein